RRVLIAGNGPLNLQVAADLAANGVEVVAVAEASGPPLRANPLDAWTLARTRPDLFRDGLRYLSTLRSRGVPLLYRHVLVRVEGEQRAESATIAQVGRDGLIVKGTEKTYSVDVVCTGDGFCPSTELTRLLGCRHEVDTRHAAALVATRDKEGRTSVREVFVAGDAGGPWGAQAALYQGKLAGLAVARELAGEDKGRAALAHQATTALSREQDFQRALWRVFASPVTGMQLADDETVACRCENVPFSAVRREIARGSTDLATIKRSTRCGMGHCQGRYCSPLIAQLLIEQGVEITEHTYFRAQAPLRPVPIDALAKTQPDIGEFATVPKLVQANANEVQAPLDTVDTVVIGSGVIGLFTARELARAGQHVAVLERNRAHAEASGANAGSLHVQFQAFGFPDLISKAAVQTPVSTLAMQRDSVHLWDEFANELDSIADLGASPGIEVEIGGGLAVADDEASLTHLRRKVEWELSSGLAIEMLSGDEARAIAPYLSPEVIAASLSRDEGKINPLKAAPAVLASALEAGVKVHEHAPVVSIEKTAAGFKVMTVRGAVTAKRVVNAAGAWCGEIAALAGDALPTRQNPIQMLVTEPSPVRIPYHLMHASRRLTLKQAANGNLIIGGGWRAAWDATANRARPSFHGISGNLAVVTRMLPGMGALLLIRSWTGTAFVTQPAIGESAKVPGLYHVITQNGMTLAPAAGRLCADLILGRPTRWDARPFSPRRFT
ncbi:MAG TPA: FAD-dependent oxidoreductase, partial [Opitutaceae bacterium]|nr:FAD-dependent oxidoreductase [Opitutaceae bacterium]